MYNWLEAVYLKQVVPPGLLVCSLEDPGSNLRSSTCFLYFFKAFFGVFSKVKGTAFVGSETDRFL